MTAFTTRYIASQFRGLLFGLVNESSTSQRMTDVVVHGLLFAKVRTDNLFTFSTLMKKRVNHIRVIFQRLRNRDFNIKFLKCHFAQSEKFLLSQVFTSDGAGVKSWKPATISSSPKPTTPTEVSYFLGLPGKYFHFTKRLAENFLCLHAFTSETTWLH